VNIFLPVNSVNVTGTASDSDGTIASYAWTQISGPVATLSNTTSATLSVSDLTEGSFTFRLTVTDNGGSQAIDDVTVNVNASTSNQPPTASAGPNIALSLPVNSTNLIGSGSDPDGSIATYNWTKVSGPAASITNQNTTVLSLSDLNEGVYIFRLTVTDNAGLTASSQAQITVLPASVNQTPNVEAGNDITITLPTNVLNLVAQASDPDGSIATYQWVKLLGPTVSFIGENSATFSLSNLVEGVYTFEIIVADDDGSVASDEVLVFVLPVGANQPPVVNGGPDKTLFQPTSTTNLAGTASDADGSIAAYEWSKVNGPAVTIQNGSTANATLTDLLVGQYVFKLTATDNTGATASDLVTVTVFPGTVNQSPLANAGSNKTIVLPNISTSLTGSGFDPDGSVAAYAWTQVAGPTCTIQNINSPTLLVDDLSEGSFQFQLSVEDNEGAVGSDVVLVTVVAEGFNLPPVADAGFDKVITLPTNSTGILGQGSDPDGTIASTSWTKKSGPAAVTLSGQSTLSLGLAGMVAGNYQFTLTVTDNQGLSNSDDVRVTVLPSTVNTNPIVSAGNDVFIREPANTTNLSAIATDLDGAITSYAWSQVSGAAASLGSTTAAALSVSNLAQGVYVFKVQVTDDDGSTSSDEITVTVAPPGANILPVVLAGAERTVSIPATSVTLNGSASDSDGAITSIGWTQESGPTSPILAGVNTTTLAVNGLQQGSYVFKLTATDNEGASASSETTVTVKGAAIPPIVFAGNDTTLVLPNNLLPLVAEVIPGDNPVVAYEWTQTDGDALELQGEFPFLVLDDLLPGRYSFLLSATDNQGLSASDTINIAVIEGKSNPIGAAIAFTPNGDAINDVWTIKNTNLVEGCPVYIFNGLGKQVFNSDQYANDWNGTSNGQAVKEGDYYYVFECGSRKTYSGALRLIR
jgi:gliding motility-associated-like protein